MLETLFMFSKREAEAASDALMQPGRAERDKSSLLLARFPELARLPASERAAALKAAQSAVWRTWPVLVSLALAAVTAAIWVWAAIMKPELAETTWLAPFLVAIVLHRLRQFLIRRELRRAQ
jgi:hypothetical protein